MRLVSAHFLKVVNMLIPSTRLLFKKTIVGMNNCSTGNHFSCALTTAMTAWIYESDNFSRFDRLCYLSFQSLNMIFWLFSAKRWRDFVNIIVLAWRIVSESTLFSPLFSCYRIQYSPVHKRRGQQGDRRYTCYLFKCCLSADFQI